MPKFLTNIDLNNNEIQNVIVQNVSTDPTTNLSEGRIIYNTGSNAFKYYSAASGGQWVTIGTGSGGEVNQNAFSTISVSGQNSVVADGTTDTVEFIAGSNVTITTNATNDTVTFAATNTDTVRTVTAGGNTLADNETLAFTAGSNVTITESAGAVTISATDTNTQRTDEQIYDLAGSMVTSSSQSGITVTHNDSLNKIEFAVSDTTVAGDTGSTGITPGDTLTIAGGTNVTTAMSGDTLTITSTDTNTFRTVTAGGNTLEASETLAFVAGTNVTITESAGSVTINASAGSDVDVNVANLTTRLGQITENVTIGDANDVQVTIAGNLVVSGTTTTVNSTTVDLNDHNITLDSGNSTASVVNGAGITIEGGSGDDATFTYSTAGSGQWELKLGTVYEDLQVDGLKAATITLGGTAITSTAAELNKLDGVTATTAELNYLDGVTSAIQTQLDGKQATLTFGITNTDAVKIDSTTVADNEYARFTAAGLESRSTTEVKSDLAITSSDISDVDAFSQSGTYSGLRAQATTAADVGLGNVTNESKATMFTNPAFTGNATAVTQAADDNDTSVATTAFTQSAIDARSYAGTVGDGTSTSISIAAGTHGLGSDSTQFLVQLVEVSSGDTVFADVSRGASGAVDLTFASAPATNAIRVLIYKIV